MNVRGTFSQPSTFIFSTICSGCLSMYTSIPACIGPWKKHFSSPKWLCDSVEVLFPYRTGFNKAFKLIFLIVNRIGFIDYINTDFWFIPSQEWNAALIGNFHFALMLISTSNFFSILKKLYIKPLLMRKRKEKSRHIVWSYKETEKQGFYKIKTSVLSGTLLNNYKNYCPHQLADVYN